MSLLRRIATDLGARKLRPAQLVVVIGAPGIGKTRYALSIAASLTLTSRPLPVLFFAPGTDKRALLRRLIAAWRPARLPLPTARAQRLRTAPLYFNNAPRLWPLEIWSHARQLDSRLRRQGERLGLILVDDLHRIGGRSYAHKVSDFKILAREMGLLIIVLARPHPSLAAALRRERVASTTLPARETPHD
ncbi:MAG: hypothetical protein A2X35_09275 [Elusimicrobia bacterium GWA2_61_42]|nr:MAG: hypothetical protein A2X35_09275 [Elusimicrobia bacterium GWA2_61_42]